MPDKQPVGSALGDIISSARRRLETKPEDPTERLKSLVAATTANPGISQARQMALQTHEAPSRYFLQIPSEIGITPKRPPKRGPARSLHISMRLAPQERDRLIQWCDNRNLSLADGVMALLELEEREGG